MNPTYCINAKGGLRACNDGEVMLCCMSKHQLTNADGNIANIKIDKLDDILNGKKAIEIRNALDNGIQHPNCQRCWDEEAGGVVSKRQRDNMTFNQVPESNTELINVELNLGTTCNLKCRTCGPWASSSWNKEYAQLGVWNGTKESYTEWLKKLNHSYDDDSVFWEEIRKKLPTIKAIAIYGGEPFMVKKQWELLKYSVDMGYSAEQTILLNTNGTHYIPEYIDIMGKFKRSHISVSIDGIEEHFEYQRHPAKWEVTLMNLLELNKFKCETWSVSVCVTINNQNMFYLDRAFKFFQDLDIHAHINILHSPEWFGVVNLPKSIKKEITDRFNSNTELHTMYKLAILNAAEYMNSREDDPVQWSRFRLAMDRIDELRSENFASVFPEFYESIKSISIN